MKTTELSNSKFKGTDFEISRLGLGCMRMTMPPVRNKKGSIETIHAALDEGVNLLNIGDFYGLFHANERLVGQALKGQKREKAFISLKYARFNPLFGKMEVGPKNVKKYIKKSLHHLKMDYVDLYQPARVDKGIPLEDTVGAISDLIKEGCVRHLGVSEVDQETLRKIHAIHPVALVESAVSITNNEIDDTIIPTAEELGIGIVGFGVLSFGKLLKNENDPLVKVIKELSFEKDVSISQIAHAWVLRKSDNMIPLMGTKKVKNLKDSIGCLNVDFTQEERNRIVSAMKTSDMMGKSVMKLEVKNGKMKRVK